MAGNALEMCFSKFGVYDNVLSIDLQHLGYTGRTNTLRGDVPVYSRMLGGNEAWGDGDYVDHWIGFRVATAIDSEPRIDEIPDPLTENKARVVPIGPAFKGE